MKRNFLLLLIITTAFIAKAQNFNDYFTNATMRIDYSFTGDVKQQNINVDEIYKSQGWYGKRKRLTEVPVEGNGQIIVKNHHSGKVIYRNSFSTLFQEWLTETDEAKTTKKSFQNVFLIPMPKDTVDITVNLFNNRRIITTTTSHQVVPQDILIREIGKKYKTPYEIIMQPKDSANCIHIAYVAEGYKEDEMNTFTADTRRCMEELFSYEPFKSERDMFEVVAVKSPSKESGTSEPGNGIWKNTALNSHFDTFYSDRYLTTLNIKDLHNWLAGIPYEHIIVLVNTEKYGGGGILNSYNLSTAHNKYTLPVVVHEFGHSFAGLADEYAYDFEQMSFYPADIEPWEPNITTLTDFKSKWADMISKNVKIPTPATKNNSNKIGAFEGAGYTLKGVYRPMQSCRMRDNSNPNFCPVCQRAIKRLIDFYTK